MKNDGWISVAERLPDTHSGCLFVNSKGLVCFGYRTSDDDPIFWDSLDNESVTATHWMPLPEPPKKCTHLHTGELDSEGFVICSGCKQRHKHP